MSCLGARRNSHKPNEVLELQHFQGKILATAAPGSTNSLASKCVTGAFSGALSGGGGTPRNTAAVDSDRCPYLRHFHFMSVQS